MMEFDRWPVPFAIFYIQEQKGRSWRGRRVARPVQVLPSLLKLVHAVLVVGKHEHLGSIREPAEDQRTSVVERPAIQARDWIVDNYDAILDRPPLGLQGREKIAQRDSGLLAFARAPLDRLAAAPDYIALFDAQNGELLMAQV